MLIRSQEGDILTSIENMDGLCIVKQIVKDSVKETFGEGHVKIIAITAKIDWTLGEYSSDEKAKAVFDMIQEEYERHITYYIGRADDIQTLGFNPPKVFKMPQDSEITLDSDKPR